MKIRQRNRLEKKPGQMPEGMLLVLILAPVVFEAGLIFFGIWMMLSGIRDAGWLILVGAAAVPVSYMDIQSAMAEYRFSPEGVSVKYPFEPLRHYPWEEFQEACVCYYSRSMEMYGYSLICLVKKGEKKDGFGRWKTGNPFRYRSVMCLDYSAELLENVRQHCPMPVHDLRDQGNYRL